MLKRRLAKLEQAVNGSGGLSNAELQELEELEDVPAIQIGGEISEELRAKMQRKRELLRNVDPSKLEFKVDIAALR